jgi:hypothetical protein
MKRLDGNSWVHCAACFVVGILFCGLLMPLLGQFTTARLAGTVLDPSGLGLAGARVTVTEGLRAFTRDTTTSSSGEYVFPSLPVGNYKITVTMSGFTSYTQNGVVLQVGQSVNLPVEMKLGAVAEEVRVTADASMVTTDSATVGQLVTQKEVAELPLNGRYAQQLVFLVPGANNVTANYCGGKLRGGSLPQ